MTPTHRQLSRNRHRIVLVLPSFLLVLGFVSAGLLYRVLVTTADPAAGAPFAHVDLKAQTQLTTTIALTATIPMTTETVLTPTVPPTETPTDVPTEIPTRAPTLTPFVVTATATPESVFAAATLVAAMTADATTTGTATAMPENMVLATNTTAPQVVTNTPTPANAATLEARVLEATAMAFTTGTATPLGNIITATPTEPPAPTDTPVPTNTTAPTNTPQPTPTATATIFYVTPTAPSADLFAAATQAMQATVDATTTGTATPLPANWRVASVRVLPYVPEPKNEATANALALEATARAITTGEPNNLVFWTATPRPTNTPAPTNTSTTMPTPADTPTETATPFVVTATPTPENVLTAAALVAQWTAEAATTGTATPLPINAVLATKTPRPIIVTSTPTAENAATAAAMSAEATAIAMTTGEPDTSLFVTATPTTVRVAAGRPANTATPIFRAFAELTATPTGSAPDPFPAQLVGKILFQANIDSRGRPEILAMDPDGSNVLVLTSTDFYDRAAERDHYSADRRFFTFVRREIGENAERQIFAYDAFYNSERQLTHFKDGSTSWDPAWSPTEELIALVSNDSQNDEIWVIGREGGDPIKLTDNDKIWDRHPSFSPSGNEIVFESNRTGQLEIWVMNKDGSNARQLTNLGMPAEKPIWVKYEDQ